MADPDILDLDVPDWAERQADLLRRHAAGEPAAGIDFGTIAGQLELIAKSEVAACRSLLTALLSHLLKACAMPDHPARPHWLLEAETFLDQARDVWSASMARRLAIGPIYDRARRLVVLDYPQADAARMPAACPFPLADLIGGELDCAALLDRLQTPGITG